MKKHLLLSSLLIIFLMSYGVFAGAGVNGLAFLKLGMGATGMSMGGAYSAVADGPNALYWNPAGMAELEYTEVMFNHLNMFNSVNQSYAAVVMPITRGSIGLSYTYLTSGDINEYLIEVSGPDVNSIPTGRIVELEDRAITLSYASNFNDNLNYGLSLKFVEEDIATVTEKSFLADFGALFKVPDSNFKLAVYLRNLGNKVKFDKDEFYPPITFGVGGAYTFDNFTFALDLVKVKQNDISVHSGLSLNFMKILNFRVGYRSNNDAGAGVSVGVGLQHNSFKLDYGYEPAGEFDDYHQISICYIFGSNYTKDGKTKNISLEERRANRQRIKQERQQQRIQTEKKQQQAQKNQTASEQKMKSKNQTSVQPTVNEKAVNNMLNFPQADLANKKTVKMLIKNGQLSEALQKINSIIVTYPDDAESYTIRGDIYFELGKIDEAINEYQKAKMLYNK